MTVVPIILLLYLVALCFIPSFEKKCIEGFYIADNWILKREKAVLFTCLILFCIITILLQAAHTMDGDEAQAWLIARDTPSLSKMYSLFGYEGSPGLWHMLLWPLTHSGASFNWIYILNHLFITGAVILWLWKSPFPPLIRILLPFTHLFLTEYSINARSYALSLFLLFIALYIYSLKKEKWLAWSISFFLLANTNIHSTFLCCGFSLFLILEYVANKKQQTIKALFIISTGVIIAVLQVLPPPDLDSGLASIGLKYNIDSIIVSVLPLNNRIEILIYLAILLQVIISIRKKQASIMLIAIQLALFIFFLFKYPGEMRHHFFLFTSILFSIWIGGIREENKSRTWLFLSTALLIMVVYSFKIVRHKLQPGTNHKKEIRDFIIKEIKPDEKTFIATYPGNVAVSFLPYFPKNTAYYLVDEKRWGSYAIWSEKRKEGLENFTGINVLAGLVAEHSGFHKYYYLTPNRIPEDSLAYYKIKLLKQSTDERQVKASSRWSSLYFYQLK